MSSKAFEAKVEKLIDSSTVKISYTVVKQHPLLKKYMKLKKTALAHNGLALDLSLGEVVVVTSGKKISKCKSYSILEKKAI